MKKQAIILTKAEAKYLGEQLNMLYEYDCVTNFGRLHRPGMPAKKVPTDFDFLDEVIIKLGVEIDAYKILRKLPLRPSSKNSRS